MGFFSELKKDLSNVNDEMGIEQTAAEKNAESGIAGENAESNMQTEAIQQELASAPQMQQEKESAETEYPTQESSYSVNAQTEQVEDNPAEFEEQMQDYVHYNTGVSEENIPVEEPEVHVKQEVPFFSNVSNSSQTSRAQFVNQKQNEMPVYNNYNTSKQNYNEDRGYEEMMDAEHVATDETAAITEGMVVSGDIQTTGSLDLIGKVVGNVTAYGKLNVTGEIEGNSTAAEIFAEAARINGDVHSQGSIKIGQSSVIIGNLYATSAVIAGAVKGDIDVHGPVVLDTTAIVMGNIKSQSVQINNGAVIEGNCSQVYADVNPTAFFEGLKTKEQ
ncbi:polymer-forming cytoskeletal protein [Butyrivibrio sp. NC3005]|jgi:cytoskeletal protein CcmA (bactofilin family)|uniref:polymer-forming cytoskeletal protein n=1 Tax=Butyrivibrio sp. NC3005 TaxID=1280685 RepID=UPI000425111B|nr:polymer-forming cytoskeletal protein [Butyrivibrio sp. NC3005]